jgi:tetratricopeptide (TPR) repeat protein
VAPVINLVLSLAVGFALALVIRLFGFAWPASIIPGTIAFIGAFVLLGRRIFLKLQAINGEVQKELSAMPPNPREQKLKIEKAIKLLEGALPYSRWQFLVEAEIQGQIGIIKYMVKDVEGAQPALERANPRNYLAQAMKGAIAFQKKDFPTMEKNFEQAVNYGKKDGLIWASYAWCLVQNKDKDKAIKVLARAVQSNPSDEKLKNGLSALQNDKKLKMKAWEPGWWQLGLETPPQPQPVFAGGGRSMRFRR